jgi:hypothetical protein
MASCPREEVVTEFPGVELPQPVASSASATADVIAAAI